MPRTEQRNKGPFLYMSRRQTLPEGHLAAPCWCERRFLSVSERDVCNGVTYSCGRPDCRKP